MQTNQLLVTQLTSTIQQHCAIADNLKQIPIPALQYKADANTWSTLECIEHLNLYLEFYLSEIKTQLQKTKKCNPTQFKSHWLGSYFAKSMLPKTKINKMKTFASKNPNQSKLDLQVITVFLNHQKQLEYYIQKTQTHYLNLKIPTTLSKYLCFRLGDTFNFIVNHNQRHLLQAQNSINKYQQSIV